MKRRMVTMQAKDGHPVDADEAAERGLAILRLKVLHAQSKLANAEAREAQERYLRQLDVICGVGEGSG